jgi:peptide/nickel transport system ATP-binding protein
MSERPMTSEATTSEDDTVLAIEDFCVDYGWGEAAVRAVNHVNLSVRRSRVLGVAGESGSGKSTLVYAATRLLRPPGVISGGRVSLTFDDPTSSDAKRRTVDLLAATQSELRAIRWSQVSIVLQSALNALNPVLRIGHEFDEVLKTHRPDMKKAQRRERAAELLSLVGLNADRLARFPHELSGGQRQRIMIALALALDPQLVIMDEPTTALDVVTQREIVNELAQLRARFGFSMIFITHDLSLLVELADDIAVMYAGNVVEWAPANDLYGAPRHPYTLGLLNSSPPLSGERRELVGIAGSPPDLSQPIAGCSFHDRCPFAFEKCSSQAPELRVLDGSGRKVACWLHDTPADVPVALRRRALDAPLVGAATPPNAEGVA